MKVITNLLYLFWNNSLEKSPTDEYVGSISENIDPSIQHKKI